MASTIEELESLITEATEAGYRGRLLERGLARSMIWSEGKLPEGSPQFAASLSHDLLSYGYTLLSMAIRLRELGGSEELCKLAFEKSATAIMDVVHNGNQESPERGFHKVLASSAYHLGRFSAKAFSLIKSNLDGQNLNQIEKLLSLLILRDFQTVESLILQWKMTGEGSDADLAQRIEEGVEQLTSAINMGEEAEGYGISSVEVSVVQQAITDNYYSSIFEFLFALECGQQTFVQRAIDSIDISLSVCSELGLVSLWWALRITKHLLTDLWNSSFHVVIPGPQSDEFDDSWLLLRWLFIASLYKRNRSEIDLWPSQLEGARRAVYDDDDLVVSLPTSAGKTRVAELSILRCLAIGKRVLFITPLRALSSQTENSLRKTFSPLGKSVSSLYGSIGTSSYEQDVLKSKDIVVGTPEKLDFALRSDPSLLDDVGLVVLDEGHMIGLNEREINYEVQIQRLLIRPDASQRRIVCLSAILPGGDQFDDFVSWLRSDKDKDAIQSDWRPTDLRYGEVVWQNNTARLDFTIGEESPFVPKFIESIVPNRPNPGIRTTPFPKNAQELTLATAWKLTEEKHTVLIYCPERRSVGAFAKAVVDLHKRGALSSVLTVPEHKIQLAKILGSEWLGENHDIVECLKIGVAVHHGALPTLFRKEMEKLLREGVLKVTVSSPTLAQGLNLAATTVIVHSLYRSGSLIEPSEFKNVVGRAGRAFVDTQGLVLHPIYDRIDFRRRKWRSLVSNSAARNMESGLFRLLASFIVRIARYLNTSTPAEVREYVMNNTSTMNFPELSTETDEQSEENRADWERHIVSLDTALLSMLGEENISTEAIPDTLDNILQSSLLQRRLNRHDDSVQNLFKSVLNERGKHIWNVTSAEQRRGYFLAGLGLSSGQQLDLVAPLANQLLVDANAYIQQGIESEAIDSILELAEIIFDIKPFVPSVLPDDWRETLTSWLKGESIRDQETELDENTLRFIEDGLVYRLPWGLEALRVRAEANNDIISDGMTIDLYELGLVVPAVENGSLNRSAAILMQAGFNSRLDAIEAVQATNATFKTTREFKLWLDSAELRNYVATLDLLKLEKSKLWHLFLSDHTMDLDRTWNLVQESFFVDWAPGVEIVPNMQVKLWNEESGYTSVLASSGDTIGSLRARHVLLDNGLYQAKVNGVNEVFVSYWGAGSQPFRTEV
ncbi:DEAD/DEAH box helicase [Vibrio diabolicus]|uniref:DEAD/DEAH box helicase n=1 Tax=Vibrio diabolicus TaxID=50719 RepID=UPI00215F55D5|nr:DEAD/DEAH box helicase [Vibrio diabolicus]MCS0325013.1 DEAD/DEAH box helicase [Vibrio diabolicus]